MNTLAGKGTLKKDSYYDIILMDLEFAFEREVLEDIAIKWQKGASIRYIAKVHKRDPDEVFLALFHLAREQRISRRFF